MMVSICVQLKIMNGFNHQSAYQCICSRMVSWSSPTTKEGGYGKVTLHERYQLLKLSLFRVYCYQPSPQPSSSSVSFGFISIFFAAIGFAAGLAAGFLAALDFDKPFGKALVGFFCD